MEIKLYSALTPDEKENYVRQMAGCDWDAGRYLAGVASDERLDETFGDGARLLLLTENDTLCAYCTLVHTDEIESEDMHPWIGFVYTFPDFRGRRYSGILIEHAVTLAKNDGEKNVYVSSEEKGLYEKYGFTFVRTMHSIHGYDTGVFIRRI